MFFKGGSRKNPGPACAVSPGNKENLQSVDFVELRIDVRVGLSTKRYARSSCVTLIICPVAQGD